MKKIVLPVLLIVMISCNNNTIEKPKKPDNLIAEGKMVAILYDMALVNSAKGVNKKILENSGLIPEHYVFKKHGVDSLQFAQSNDYYSFRNSDYISIYNQVQQKLEKDKNKYQTVIDTEKKERDSINKVRKREKDSLNRIMKTRLDSLKKLPGGLKGNAKEAMKIKKQLDPLKNDNNFPQ